MLLPCHAELGKFQLCGQKIKEAIGYSTEHTVKEGVEEMYGELSSGKLTDTIKTRTVEWYKKLLSDETVAKDYLINNRIL